MALYRSCFGDGQRSNVFPAGPGAGTHQISIICEEKVDNLEVSRSRSTNL